MAKNSNLTAFLRHVSVCPVVIYGFVVYGPHNRGDLNLELNYHNYGLICVCFVVTITRAKRNSFVRQFKTE